MQISTRSMLYRSASFWGNLFSLTGFSSRSHPDLCSFLRIYVWRMFYKSMILTFLGFCALGALMDAGIFLFGGHWSLLLPKEAYLSDAILIAGILVWSVIGMGIAALLIAGGILGIGWLYKRFVLATGEALADTVVGQYINGKLHRFCPRLEFVNPVYGTTVHPEESEGKV